MSVFNTSHIPFDNLYKFLALTGLLLLVGTTIYIDREQSGLNVEIETLSADIQSMDNIVNIYNEHSIADETRREMFDKYTEFQISIASMKARLAVNRIRQKRMQSLTFPLAIIRTAGLFMTCIGFFLWYTRVQLPLDKKLKKEAGSNA